VEFNAVSLTGQLAATEPLRHTPAGLPLFRFRLAHKSVQVEADFRRQVECEVACVAMGDAAVMLSRLGGGTQVKVTGFLNRKNRMSTQLVLHANSTEIVRETNHGNDEQGRPGTG
jgi:primosomal replication protein N